MNNESKPLVDFNNEPEPIDPEIYKNLTPGQEEAMNKLMTETPNMSKAEALRNVLAKEKWEQEHSLER